MCTFIMTSPVSVYRFYFVTLVFDQSDHGIFSSALRKWQALERIGKIVNNGHEN